MSKKTQQSLFQQHSEQNSLRILEALERIQDFENGFGFF